MKGNSGYFQEPRVPTMGAGETLGIVRSFCIHWFFHFSTHASGYSGSAGTCLAQRSRAARILIRCLDFCSAFCVHESGCWCKHAFAGESICRMIDLDAILVMNQFYVRPPS